MRKRYRRSGKAELQYLEVTCMNVFVWKGMNKLQSE